MGEPMKADRVALIRERLAAGLPVEPGDVIALADSHERLRAEAADLGARLRQCLAVVDLHEFRG